MPSHELNTYLNKNALAPSKHQRTGNLATLKQPRVILVYDLHNFQSRTMKLLADMIHANLNLDVFDSPEASTSKAAKTS